MAALDVSFWLGWKKEKKSIATHYYSKSAHAQSKTCPPHDLYSLLFLTCWPITIVVKV